MTQYEIQFDKAVQLAAWIAQESSIDAHHDLVSPVIAWDFIRELIRDGDYSAGNRYSNRSR